MSEGADFYLGKGKYARYLGSVRADGDLAFLDENYDLFGFDIRESEETVRVDRPTRYTESEWLHKVQSILDAEDGVTEWPWPHRDSRGTRFAYAWDNGNITAWVYGRQLMLAYPNLARGDGLFPTLGTDDGSPVSS